MGQPLGQIPDRRSNISANAAAQPHKISAHLLTLHAFKQMALDGARFDWRQFAVNQQRDSFSKFATHEFSNFKFQISDLRSGIYILTPILMKKASRRPPIA